MGLLGDVLELAATSHLRWRTMHATVTEYSHLERQNRSIERSQLSFVPKRTSPPGDPWKVKQAERPADFTSHAQLWATAADRYRIETAADTEASDDDGYRPRTTVRDGVRSWMMTAGGQLTVHDRSTSFGGSLDIGANLLLDPRAILSAHTDVQPKDAGDVGEVDGRAAVGAVLRGASPGRSGSMMMFWPGWLGDETTVDLDEATGIIIGLRSTVDGELMRSFALTDLVIDGALDDALFTEQPPTDVPAKSAIQQPDPVAVVAGTVSFTLFAPTGGESMAFKQSQTTDGQMVSVHMMPNFANRSQMVMPTVLQQSPSLSMMPTTDEWEAVSLRHGPAWIWQAEADPESGNAGEVHVRLDRGGTHIWLRGPHDRAEAVNVAERLEPVVPAR